MTPSESGAVKSVGEPSKSSSGSLPAGATLVAALYAVGGGIGLLFALAPSVAAAFPMFVGQFFGAYPFPGGAGFLGAQVLGLVVAFGLWKGFTWAWYASLAFAVESGAGHVTGLTYGAGGWGIFGLVLAIAIVWYFLAPDVQKHFRVHYAVPWKYPW